MVLVGAYRGVSTTNALGNSNTEVYDAANQQIASEDPLGFRSTNVYNAVGQSIETIDPLGNVSTDVYNVSGLLVSSVNPLGFRSSVTYDAASRLICSIDANGNVSTSGYDQASQMIASENALGQRTSTAYDAAGRMISLENPQGFRTTSVYDSRNLKTENIDPLGRITTSLFDAAGRQVVRLDARGNSTTFSYDSEDNNIGRAYPDGSLVTFSFSAVSNRISMQDNTGDYSYEYTTRNQMESAVNPSGRIVTYTFDSLGLMSTLTDSAGRVMTYQYDDASRLEGILEIGGGRTTFAYDAASRRVLKQLANGARASLTYDSASQLSELANLKSDDSVLSDFQFSYDSVGNRVSTLENTGDRVTWSYDTVYQLTGDDRSGTGAYQRSFVYDDNGNRLVKDADGQLTTSTYDGAGQLSTSEDTAGTTVYSYDHNGNQSLSVAPTGQRTTSSWGFENQVGLVALPSGQLVTATYNADNRRTTKTNNDGATNFNWDPINDNVLLETDEVDAVAAEYSNLPVSFGEPLSQSRHGVPSFFHFDGNYSTRQLTDSSQNVTDVSIFTGFGEKILRTGTTVKPFGYKGEAGYYTNLEIGDIYVRNRTYKPIIGRWLSMDPLGFVDGMSLYRGYFVPGELDPDGLACASKCDVDYMDIIKNSLQQVKNPRSNNWLIWNLVSFELKLIAPSKNTDCIIRNFKHGKIKINGKVVDSPKKWTKDGPPGAGGIAKDWWDSTRWWAGVGYIPITGATRPPYYDEKDPWWASPQKAHFFDSPGRTRKFLSAKMLPAQYDLTFKTELVDKATGLTVSTILDWSAHWSAALVGKKILIMDTGSSYGTATHPFKGD